ncbi:MAG: GTPase ObgE [SAR202 cluster bacterium]|nr:GTPase ObgE [SAR202 cluster bacterium]|tara:strand:- start:9054 stop:10322 length:1269 start_codon:yes stop_codon:yes gene_type:complete
MLYKITINITSGKGGDGIVNGRKEKFIPYGGPDGGNGGNGGNIYFLFDQNESNISQFLHSRKFKAQNGENGSKRNRHGKSGKDIIIRIPPETKITNLDTKTVLIEEGVHGQKVLIAKGGKGGRGNAEFVSSTNQYPLISEAGEQGERITLQLELNILAEIGIIGCPNAGKSSLLSKISNAKPKIANYPFTTLEPQVGVVLHGDSEITAVEIPGLLENAHKGVGLGTEFLRHLQKTKFLLHLVNGESLDPVADYQLIRNEMKYYQRNLMAKQEIVVLTKGDLPQTRQNSKILETNISEDSIWGGVISTFTNQGISGVLNRILNIKNSQINQNQDAQEPNRNIEIIYAPVVGETNQVIKDSENVYRIEYASAKRVAKNVDQNDLLAWAQFLEYVRSIGALGALKKSGAKQGDTVIVGDISWIME